MHIIQTFATVDFINVISDSIQPHKHKNSLPVWLLARVLHHLNHLVPFALPLTPPPIFLSVFLLCFPCSPFSVSYISTLFLLLPHHWVSPPCQLTQPLQGAVAVDLRFHGQLVGRRQLGQIVEGVGEGRMAAVVSHTPTDNAAATNGAATGTFPATCKQGGSRGELGGVVHTGSTLWRDRNGHRQRKMRRRWEKKGEGGYDK